MLARSFSMQLLFEEQNGGVAGATLRCHAMGAPGTLDRRGDGGRNAQQLVLNDRVGFGHALVDTRRHVVEELATAALHEHLGQGLAALGRLW